MTDNPWPSSDSFAFIADRRFVAAACLALALLALIARSIRDLRRGRSDGDVERSTAALMLIGTITTTVVVGLFDAVLLIAVPTLFFWLLIGVLAPPVDSKRTIATGVQRLAPTILVGLGVLAIGRSAMQIAAMSTYSASSRLSVIESAAGFDPA